VFTYAPEAEGHGTDAAIDSYHHRQGFIRPRVPLIKIVSSALTISTGGSGGREGPIAQIGAGFGSFLGSVLKLRPAERRVLMAAGMGAGVAAIFRAPLAGALFASEVLYFSPDFESEVIMPSALASVAAYCTFGLAFGWSPLFSLAPEQLAALSFHTPWELLPYTLLAVFCVIMAMIYTRSFYGLTHAFHGLTIPRHFKPAIGAALSAVVGLVLYYAFGEREQVLAVLSFGYGILQTAITLAPWQEGSLTLAAALFAVALGKILTTSLTIGSGGSGGVFGPSMVIGGCGGGALGIVLHVLWPAAAPHPSAFVVVGMAGFFAAAAKTPFSTLVIVSEMTGGYNLLLPTLWVCALSFLLSDEQSIYSSQVESRSRSPAHQAEFVRGMLQGLSVAQFVRPIDGTPCLSLRDRLDVIRRRLSDNPQGILPVVDDGGRLEGIISVEEVFAALQMVDDGDGALVIAADLVRVKVTPLVPQDSVDRAMELFVVNDLLELPVVADLNALNVVGTVRRMDIAAGYLRRLQGVELPGPSA
jgi:CIC family chloride channel protein